MISIFEPSGRSLGDEPFLVSQFVRIAFDIWATSSVERILAQGQASGRALDGLQRLLSEEECTPFLVNALRGERARIDAFLRALEDGKVSLPRYAGVSAKPSSTVTGVWESLTSRAAARRAHPVLLRLLTESIQTAQLPTEQRADRFEIQEKRVKETDLPVLVNLLFPAMITIAKSDIRVRANLRCAVVALAAERFRLANGRWPKDLAELVPAYLKKVPLDPYDGKPIRLRAVPDGLLVYSIGPDRQDNGGAINRRTPDAPGQDIVFQLWNVDARRKPALNPDVCPPQPTEEELQMMRWQLLPVQKDVPPEKPGADQPPP